MWGRRPKYDDTFGVRMDLGADRIDPLSARAVPRPVSFRPKQTVIVETPGSIFDIFRRPPDFGPAPQKSRERPARPAQAVLSGAPETNPAESFRRFESWIAGLVRRLPVQHRIAFSVLGVWFLLTTGLFMPAILLLIVYAILRARFRAAA